MQKARNQLSLTFPQEYLQRFEEIHGRYYRLEAERRRAQEPLNSSGVFTSRCKQAVVETDNIYCGALRKQIDARICKCCPHYDQEPLEYSLFRRG